MNNKKLLIIGAIIVVLVLLMGIAVYVFVIREDTVDAEAEIEAIENEEKTVKEVIEESTKTVSATDIFAKARNSQRQAAIAQILNGITQYISDGNSISSLGAINSCTNPIKIGTNEVDLNKTLVDKFLVLIPTDPSDGDSKDTGYTICKTGEKITIAAPNAEAGKTIEVSR